METFKVDLTHEKPETLIFLNTKSVVIGYRSGFLEIFDIDIENDDYSSKSSYQSSFSSVRSLQKYSETEFFVGGDKDIHLYNIKFELLRTLEGHDDSVEYLGMDGSTLFSASEDCTVCSWNIKSSTSTELYSHSSPIISMDLSPSLGQIATGSSDQDLIIYSIKERKISNTDKELDSKIWSLKFIPNKGLLAIGTHDSNIIIRKVPSLENFSVLVGHESRIKSLDLCEKNELLVSASFDQKVGLWDLNTLQLKSLELNHDDWVRKVIISDQGNLILSVGDDSRMFIRKQKKEMKWMEKLGKKFSEFENFFKRELKNQIFFICICFCIALIYSNFCCILLQLAIVALWVAYEFSLKNQFTGNMINAKIGINSLVIGFLFKYFCLLYTTTLNSSIAGVALSVICAAFEYFYATKTILPYSLPRSVIICLTLGIISERLHILYVGNFQSSWLGAGVMLIWIVFEYLTKASASTNDFFVMNFSLCLFFDMGSKYFASFVMNENESFHIGIIAVGFYIVLKNIPRVFKILFN
jgi:hypothetical protein